MKEKLPIVIIKTALFMILSFALAYVFKVSISFNFYDTLFIMSLIYLLCGLIPSGYDFDISSNSQEPMKIYEETEDNSSKEIYIEDSRDIHPKILFTTTRISLLVSSFITLIISMIN